MNSERDVRAKIKRKITTLPFGSPAWLAISDGIANLSVMSALENQARREVLNLPDYLDPITKRALIFQATAVGNTIQERLADPQDCVIYGDMRGRFAEEFVEPAVAQERATRRNSSYLEEDLYRDASASLAVVMGEVAQEYVQNFQQAQREKPALVGEPREECVAYIVGAHQGSPEWLAITDTLDLSEMRAYIRSARAHERPVLDPELRDLATIEERIRSRENSQLLGLTYLNACDYFSHRVNAVRAEMKLDTPLVPGIQIDKTLNQWLRYEVDIRR